MVDCLGRGTLGALQTFRSQCALKSGYPESHSLLDRSMGLMFCRQCHHLRQRGSSWQRTRITLPSSFAAIASSPLSIRTPCRTTVLHIQLQVDRRCFSYRWAPSPLTYRLPERYYCTLASPACVAANISYSRTPEGYVWHKKLDSFQRRYYGMRNGWSDMVGLLTSFPAEKMVQVPEMAESIKEGTLKQWSKSECLFEFLY